MNTEALERAIKAAGGQKQLADLIGTTQSHVSYWLNKSKRVPAERAIDIERETGIPRRDLRPDLFAESVA